MNILNRWAGWEAVFLHAMTGLLFALVVVTVVLKTVSVSTWLLALLIPLFAVSALGWLGQARVILRATRRLRRQG